MLLTIILISKSKLISDKSSRFREIKEDLHRNYYKQRSCANIGGLNEYRKKAI